MAALTPRSEERARGWNGLVVGIPFVLLFGLWEAFGISIPGPSNRDLTVFLPSERSQEFFSGA